MRHETACQACGACSPRAHSDAAGVPEFVTPGVALPPAYAKPGGCLVTVSVGQRLDRLCRADRTIYDRTVSLFEDELRVLLRDLESDRVERKESAADPDKLSQAICAFANDMPGHGLPGVLFVGVTDSGQLISDSVSDKQLLVLAALRDQGASSRRRQWRSGRLRSMRGRSRWWRCSRP